MYWLRQLNKMLYNYDRELYAVDNGDKITVYRKAYTWESYDLEGLRLTYARPSHHYIFSLTDNWTMSGKRRNWGIEPILNHLKAIDPWRNPNLCNEIVRQHEKAAESRERNSKNKHEDLAREILPDFKKAFSDVNTSTMNNRRIYGNR